MNEELKPCPFCGSKARFVKVSDTMGSMKLTAWKVQCSKCWCSPYPNNAHGDKHVVAQQWNTRAERTCENVHLSSGFRCNECKTTWHTLMRDEAGDWQKTNPKFCPNCGAKVTGAKEVDDER